MLVFPTRALPLWQYTDNTKGIKPNRVPGIPGALETALKLKAQVENSSQNQSAYVEALSIALAHELMCMNESVPSLVPRLRGRLSGWQQKKLMQYLDEHLAENISP
jgi:hypothetical protein